jgi:hypothetical protein
LAWVGLSLWVGEGEGREDGQRIGKIKSLGGEGRGREGKGGDLTLPGYYHHARQVRHPPSGEEGGRRKEEGKNIERQSGGRKEKNAKV